MHLHEPSRIYTSVTSEWLSETPAKNARSWQMSPQVDLRSDRETEIAGLNEQSEQRCHS